MSKRKVKYHKIIKEWNEASKIEVWNGIKDNFIYGFLAAILIVATTLRNDLIVLTSFVMYYYFVGRIINRPKYITDLGKLVVFPIPSALGAFTGYKLGYILLTVIHNVQK
jgi:hypothetical protein